jgi:pyruvate ferredoxin oxidoreductase alpha subunit
MSAFMPGRKQVEGSHAVAEAIALSRPQVISCYPITPQTHIVEGLSAMVRSGALSPCEFMNVESEFAALSALIGASAAGARTYTATSSQGLLFMAEAVYNASGLGLPIVMTIGNRAIGAPINIWNDHSDSMALRDSGWIQLHAESNQEALDLHIQAFRLAEQLSCPVMVCMDGFILTHAYEEVDMPSQAQVDAFLPPFVPQQVLDPSDPITIGAMVGPDAYMEVRYLLHHKHLQAVEVIENLRKEFKQHFGRDSGGLVSSYRADDAETLVLAMGSINGTIREAVDEMREEGHRIGSVKLCSYRPFPLEALREALKGAKRVIILEKNLATGLGGILASNTRMALRGLNTPVNTIIAGLGGRPIPKNSLVRAFKQIEAAEVEEPHFLDMNWPAINEAINNRGLVKRRESETQRVLRSVRGAELTEAIR